MSCKRSYTYVDVLCIGPRHFLMTTLAFWQRHLKRGHTSRTEVQSLIYHKPVADRVYEIGISNYILTIKKGEDTVVNRCPVTFIPKTKHLPADKEVPSPSDLIRQNFKYDVHYSIKLIGHSGHLSVQSFCPFREQTFGRFRCTPESFLRPNTKPLTWRNNYITGDCVPEDPNVAPLASGLPMGLAQDFVGPRKSCLLFRFLKGKVKERTHWNSKNFFDQCLFP